MLVIDNSPKEFVKLGEGKADISFNKRMKAIEDGKSEELHDFKRGAEALLQDMIEEFRSETGDSRWEDGGNN